MFCLWCHCNREIGITNEENGKKRFKLFLTLNIKLSEEEEESNDDS